jgi:hypothetical protein
MLTFRDLEKESGVKETGSQMCGSQGGERRGSQGVECLEIPFCLLISPILS